LYDWKAMRITQKKMRAREEASVSMSNGKVAISNTVDYSLVLIVIDLSSADEEVVLILPVNTIVSLGERGEDNMKKTLGQSGVCLVEGNGT
jgi:hypothetical protein